MNKPIANRIKKYFKYIEFVFVEAAPLPAAPKVPIKGMIHTGQTISLFNRIIKEKIHKQII
jgi:hypothetical protein